MTRCLVTGARGFVGSHVLRCLLEETDWELDCPTSGAPGPSADPRVRFWSHDLREPLPTVGPFEYVVDLAARANLGWSLEEPAAAVRNNVLVTTHVMDYCRRVEPLRVLHLSTEEQWNRRDGRRLATRSAYAASKLAQETVALAYREAHGVPVVVLNADIVVGAGQPVDKVVPAMAARILAGEPVRVWTHAGRPGTRCYTPARNLAGYVGRLLRASPGYLDGVVRDHDPRFAADGEVLDNAELARLVARVLGRELTLEAVERPDVRPGDGKVCGVQLAPRGGEVTLEETVREMLADQLREETA